MQSIRDGSAELGGDDARHLSRVLRAEAGQRYEISDNRDPYLAEIVEVGRDRVVFRVVEPLGRREPPCEAIVYAALFKFDRFEWMLEKATELGAAALVPFEAERTERGLADAARKRVERWRRLAREASQQSRRDRTPGVSGPAPWRACLADPAAYRYLLDETPGAAPLAAALPDAARRRTSDRVALLAGPEGGWTENERAEAIAAGWTPVSLGPLVLRAETATVAALSVLASTWWAAASG